MRIQLLWFEDCPNHEQARATLRELLQQRQPDVDVEEIEVSDPDLADGLQFPGSPTIRINGKDVEPGFEDPGASTPPRHLPRCRVYLTENGLTGTPETTWIEQALESAILAEA